MIALPNPETIVRCLGKLFDLNLRYRRFGTSSSSRSTQIFLKTSSGFFHEVPRKYRYCSFLSKNLLENQAPAILTRIPLSIIFTGLSGIPAKGMERLIRRSGAYIEKPRRNDESYFQTPAISRGRSDRKYFRAGNFLRIGH